MKIQKGEYDDMISHGKDIKIFTGNANPKLAQDICRIIGTQLGDAEVKRFADGEDKRTNDKDWYNAG